MLKTMFNDTATVYMAIVSRPFNETTFAFDIDGTLAGFQDNPSDVVIPSEPKNSLIHLSKFLPVAFISGRGPEEGEALTFRTHASYGHGAFIRRSAEHDLETSGGHVNEAAIDDLLKDLVLPENVRIETKNQARAIHWNKSELPEEIIEPMIRQIVENVVNEYNRAHAGDDKSSAIKFEAGRMVYEIGSTLATKGAAVDMFKAMQPFIGKRMVYFGDQPADESAMKANRDGLNIGVGKDAPLIAHYHLSGPEDVHKIINALANNQKWISEAPTFHR